MPTIERTIDRSISHYRLLHQLGSGGMGEVYAAFDETLQRRVALKAIRPEHRLNADSKARFLREARMLSQLDHPNICRVHDYVEHDDGDWLVLELIEGRSLRTAMEHGLEHAHAMRIAEQIASVLLVTHAAGVVHRDLKPANVMLTAAGDVKVLDFGLARSAFVPGSTPVIETPAAAALPSAPESDLAPDLTRSSPGTFGDGAGLSHFLTAHGAITGTLAYMSPEQARGETAAPASDLYSFGVMLQEMFARRPAYPPGLDYVRFLDRAQRGDTLPVTGVSSDLATLIARLKAPNASQRPTAVDVAERLRWIRDKPRRRLRRAVAATIAAVLLLGAVKYTIDLARERNAAVLARQDADRRRDQAEALIGYMLGDLREKLRQVGRLELLEGVGQKATTYFEMVPASMLTREELFHRSQAMHQIGQIRQQLGDLSGATRAYRDSLDLARQVAAQDPANSSWQVGLATAHFYVGESLRLQGDMTGAMREFSAYRDVARALVDRDPSNPQWQMELAYGHSNVAAALEAQSDLTGAVRELEQSRAITQKLVVRDPANRQWQQSLATGHNRLGALLDKLGDGNGALPHYLADLDIRRQLVVHAPGDNSIKRSLITALLFAGRAHEERGDTDTAIRDVLEARDVANSLVAIDSRNADWRRDLAIVEHRIGWLEWLADRHADAQSHCQRGYELVRPIADAAPSHLARQRDVANVLLCLGLTQLSQGNLNAAEATSGSLSATLTPLVAQNDQEALLVAAQARLFGATLAEQRRNDQQARRLREEALELMTAGSASAADKRRLALRARALIALHRIEETRPLVASLTASGYRHPLLVREWRAATGSSVVH